MSDEPEVHGLLALMLVNDARREARFADETIVLLKDRDRSLWDLDQIEEARTMLEAKRELDLDGYHYLHATRGELLSGSSGPRMRAPPTSERTSSSTPTRSASSSNSGSPSFLETDIRLVRPG